MSKTTRKTYTPKFKMAVAIDVVRGEKTLSQVAAEHGVKPAFGRGVALRAARRR